MSVLGLDKLEKSKEMWLEAELYRVAGEVALKSLAPDTEKQKSILITHSLSRGNSKQSPGNSAPQ
jgi:hypothetical protein